MANLDELQRLDAEIRRAEQRAVQGVADHLREAVRDLPSESRLGLTFIQHADKLELWAKGKNVEPWARRQLSDLERDLESLDGEDA